VVETGVANGSSSFFILSAIQANGGGTLWSLEPEGRGPFVPEGFEPGWLVPERLRGAWRLLRQDSRDGLPKVWSEAGAPDVFFHDSEHSFEVMRFEYEAAWPHIRPGGLLASDDVFFNEAFEGFSAEKELEPLIWRTRLGFLRKRT
jgi:predicted O-methyltransferase YrrM